MAWALPLHPFQQHNDNTIIVICTHRTKIIGVHYGDKWLAAKPKPLGLSYFKTYHLLVDIFCNEPGLTAWALPLAI